MDTTSKMYLALVLIILLVAGIVSAYTYIKNFISNKKAEKRKVSFKKKNGREKGYWKTKRGEEYDKDLKLED